MPDSLSPVTMTEDYYAKIAGQDVTPPDPATREQKWLDAIADRVDGLAEDVEDLGDIVPTPEAADSGKVLTAGADGTASWQTASGGAVIAAFTYQNTEGGVVVNRKTQTHTVSEIMALIASGVSVIAKYSTLDDSGASEGDIYLAFSGGDAEYYVSFSETEVYIDPDDGPEVSITSLYYEHGTPDTWTKSPTLHLTISP